MVDGTVGEGNSQELTIPTTGIELGNDGSKQSNQPESVPEKRVEKESPQRKAIREFAKQSGLLNGVEPEAGKVTESPKKEVQADAPKPTPIVAPADMTTEEKAIFDQAPPELQRYLSRRSYEVRNQITQKAQEAGRLQKEASSVLDVVNPVRHEYEKQGIAVEDVVRRSIAWDKAFKSDPIGAAREYLDAYGIDPYELLSGESYQRERQQYNPEDIQALVREEASRIAELQNEQHHVHLATTEVQKFVSEKPLFQDPGTAEQLEAAMAPVVEALRASNPSKSIRDILETAYNYVTRGEERFSSVLQKIDGAKVADRARQEGQEALRAGRSITGGPGTTTGSPTRKVNDFRENLRLRMRGVL